MTRALILAAGQGTRLRPLTDDKPKCLVSLLGKSLLERQTHTLRQAGIDNIHVATGYRAEQIENLGYATTLNPRFAETNMVETLFSAKAFIRQTGDLIIAYGDIVYQSNNLEALMACDDEIALMIDSQWREFWSVRLEDPLSDAETLKIDTDGYVVELGKKPDSYEQIEGQYTGLIKVRADKLDQFIAFYGGLDRSASYDGKDFDNMYMTSFLQLLINAGWKAKAVEVSNGWLEIDSVEDLREYENLAREGTLDRFYKIEC
jgi:choline kinase